MNEWLEFKKWVFDAVKKQGLSFILIAYIAWQNQKNLTNYKQETRVELSEMQLKIEECNEYNITVVQNALDKYNEQLIFNTMALQDNTEVMEKVKDRL